MRNAWRVPTRGSEFGKYSLAKTSPVTVLYKKKSYHSIAVPTVLATTARLSWRRCSSSEIAPADATALVIARLRIWSRHLFDCSGVKSLQSLEAMSIDGAVGTSLGTYCRQVIAATPAPSPGSDRLLKGR